MFIYDHNLRIIMRIISILENAYQGNLSTSGRFRITGKYIAEVGVSTFS